MNKEEMKKLIEQLNNSKEDLVVATVPENGDEMTIFSSISVIKPRLLAEGRPLRLTSPSEAGISSNTFGELDKILSSEEYFDKFYKLATQFGKVVEIYVLN